MQLDFGTWLKSCCQGPVIKNGHLMTHMQLLHRIFCALRLSICLFKKASRHQHDDRHALKKSMAKYYYIRLFHCTVTVHSSANAVHTIINTLLMVTLLSTPWRCDQKMTVPLPFIYLRAESKSDPSFLLNVLLYEEWWNKWIWGLATKDRLKTSGHYLHWAQWWIFLCLPKLDLANRCWTLDTLYFLLEVIYTWHNNLEFKLFLCIYVAYHWWPDCNECVSY